MARSLEEINKEYTDNCARLGDSIYRRSLLDSTIQQLVQRNSELQAEATKLEEKGENDDAGQSN